MGSIQQKKISTTVSDDVDTCVLEVEKELTDTQIDARQNTGSRTVRQAKDVNIVSAYLKEIRQWPILKKEQEQLIARTLSEAEYNKRILAVEWAQLFEKILLWNRLAKHQDLDATLSNKETKSLLRTIKEIASLTDIIRDLEARISQKNQSYYKRKKLSREKANQLLSLHEVAGQCNVLKMYRSGLIRTLYPYIMKQVTRKHKKEIIHILRAYTIHDRQAKKSKEMLVRSNLRLVVGIAKKYTNRGLPFSDLIQEGNIGLMRAIDKFDYRLGNRLSTYASWWIRQTIIRAIEEKSSTIRVPIYINDKIKRISRQSADPDHDADEAVPVPAEGESENLYFAMQLVRDPISLETPFGEDGSNLHECIADTIPPSPMDKVLQYQLFNVTEDALKDLPPRDERILRLRFGLGVDAEHTLEEIGEKFGISRERVRQIETAALRKIRASHNSEVLQPFLYKEIS